MTPTFRIAADRRRRHRQGSDARRPARAEGRRRALRLRARDPRRSNGPAATTTPQHGQMMPDDWKQQLEGVDAIYFGAVGWPADGARPRLAVGLAAQVPPRVRPVHQPAAGAPVRRRALPARRPQARRHRLLRRAREHRGRVHQPRRRDVRGHRARDRDPGVGVLAPRHRPRAAVRLRARAVAPAQAPDRGDQEQRHRDQHALVGRPRRRDRQATIPRCRSTSSTSTS